MVQNWKISVETKEKLIFLSHPNPHLVLGELSFKPGIFETLSRTGKIKTLSRTDKTRIISRIGEKGSNRLADFSQVH